MWEARKWDKDGVKCNKISFSLLLQKMIDLFHFGQQHKQMIWARLKRWKYVTKHERTQTHAHTCTQIAMAQRAYGHLFGWQKCCFCLLLSLNRRYQYALNSGYQFILNSMFLTVNALFCAPKRFKRSIQEMKTKISLGSITKESLQIYSSIFGNWLPIRIFNRNAIFPFRWRISIRLSCLVLR